MVEHLGEVLEFIDVIEIMRYERFVEVRLKNVSQEVAVGLAVYEAFLKKGRIDFMMCLAGEEEFDQDLFNGVRSIGRVKDADEIFVNVSYIKVFFLPLFLPLFLSSFKLTFIEKYDFQL